MKEQTNSKKYIKSTEALLLSEIKAIVLDMDRKLNDNPDGIGFIPKPLLSVFESQSTLKGKGRYKASTSDYAYYVPRSKAPQSQRQYQTSYKLRPLVHHLFLAVANHNYDYNTQDFLSSLPKVINATIHTLALWGLNMYNTKARRTTKPLEAINTVFSLLSDGSPKDYLQHIQKKYNPCINLTKIQKIIHFFTDDYMKVTFILSGNDCMLIANGECHCVKVSDNISITVKGHEFLMTHDGVTNEEMKYFGDSLRTIDFQQEVKLALASTKTKNK
ncbi:MULTISPECIES: hypothetical protein [Pseudomonas]|uniref:Uncharacterized protein n=1 Tax=Pseudomonas putida (strain DOT-T1E) TaxID=1196325 RepID=I7B120_PSEPT|nr:MULTISPECIES: hypothetical protein [Pseudomonas]AFO48725.1 hypothetical protein T1E_2886 [Pseudomonas putida DOT-T1E]UZM92228.1 hypothetical protein OPZ46_20480 [Pseudomonas putida DOT-T1E]